MKRSTLPIYSGAARDSSRALTWQHSTLSLISIADTVDCMFASTGRIRMVVHSNSQARFVSAADASPVWAFSRLLIEAELKKKLYDRPSPHPRPHGEGVRLLSTSGLQDVGAGGVQSQCRLSRQNLLRMTDSLTDLVSVAEDHVVIIDIGPAESVRIKVESIGRPFRPIERTAVVV